jgi:raffinose/stachyose/melibiose transport system substrate-binding protein
VRKTRILFLCASAAIVAIGAAVSLASSPSSRGADSVTLTYVDDIYTDPASSGAQQEMIQLFEKQNPGVKIKYVPKPFSQWVPTAKLALQGSGAPDVLICAAYDTCNAALVKAGLIIPQEKYARQYNWFKNTPAELVRETRHEKDGTTFRGQSYGPAQTYDLVGMYYNKAKLRKLGLKPPRTQAEFEKVLAAAKKAGETPIMFGDLSKVDLAYTFMQLLAYQASPQVLRNWMYRKPGSSNLAPALARAAETLKRWSDSGYFTSDIFGIEQSTAIDKFNNGDGVFVLTGAWWTGLLTKLGKDAGFMLYPPKKAGAPPRAIFSFSNSMLISSKSKNPDLAAKFIALLVSPKTTGIRVRHGLNATPIWAVKTSDATTSTGREVLQAMKDVNGRGESIPWLDASPRLLLDIWGSGLQEVLGGKISPADFAKQSVAEHKKQVQERIAKGYR